MIKNEMQIKMQPDVRGASICKSVYIPVVFTVKLLGFLAEIQ